MNLKQRFYNTLDIWIKGDDEKWSRWKALLDAYTHAERKYHNLNHLRELLHYFDSYKNQLEHPIEVEYAIFYHDIVYNVWSKKNELNSAELAIDLLIHVEKDDKCLERIHQLIMATKDHTSYTNDEKWMIDFDLAILGQSWDIYLEYTKQIREEYKSVPNFMYRRGRKKVLQHFLNKKRIYATDTFYEQYELIARENLKKELIIL